MEVRISVYKLELTGVGFLDHIGAGLVGTYHTGLVVGGKEFAFGGHDEAGKSGVYATKPELNKDYLFYQRIVLGTMESTPEEAVQVVREMARQQKWHGPSYDLIDNNCNHFVSDLCWAFLRIRPPDWINSTAESIGISRRRSKYEKRAFEKACDEYRSILPPTDEATGQTPSAELAMQSTSAKAQAGKTVSDLPGGKAFEDAFTGTFELCWNRGMGGWRRSRETCPQGRDPLLHRKDIEEELVSHCTEAAKNAALVVSWAARLASEARASQPAASTNHEWDAVWAKASAPLLRTWREDADAGRLDPDPSSSQGQERDHRLKEVLAAAAAAAAAAASNEAANRRRSDPSSSRVSASASA